MVSILFFYCVTVKTTNNKTKLKTVQHFPFQQSRASLTTAPSTAER